MTPARPGDLLADRYRLRGVIGRGGMGVVWVAADELLNRDVAVKESVRPPYLDDAEWAELRERSLDEARTAARLSHQNIVGIFDILEHDGQPWLVMQLLPFPSLRDVTRTSGPVSPVRAARIGLCLLSAIRAAHSAGILHRDVKPGNVLLGPDDQVVLTDFGLAVTEGSPHATRSGTIMGSPAYMSPERARGEPSGPAADLWSLGATLYAAVEGRDPFERSGSAAVLAAVLTDEPDAPARAGPLWPVISGLLRKDPLQRLTADQAQRMLESIAGADRATRPAASAAGQRTARHTVALPAPPYQYRNSGQSPTSVQSRASGQSRAAVQSPVSVRSRGSGQSRHTRPSRRSRSRARGQRRAGGLTAAVLASVVAVGLGAFLAAGKLVREHAAVPPVTRSAGPALVPSAASPSASPSHVPGRHLGHLHRALHHHALHHHALHHHAQHHHRQYQHGDAQHGEAKGDRNGNGDGNAQ